jgi:hypothetical protein
MENNILFIIILKIQLHFQFTVKLHNTVGITAFLNFA